MKEIRLIEIELFSFCNRTCVFCPNSYIDRLSDNKVLDIEAFKRLIQDLKSISYSKYISLSRYCEPLAHRDILDDRISYIRKHLPLVTIVANTNGDYEYDGVDIDELTVMDYDIKMTKENLGLLKRSTKPYLVRKMRLGKLNNRAGALELKKKYVRDFPCYEPSYFMGVDYNGSVVPCCNMRSDVKLHEDFILGNIRKSSILDIWNSPKAEKFRKDTREAKFSSICLACSKGPGRYTVEHPNIMNKTT